MTSCAGRSATTRRTDGRHDGTEPGLQTDTTGPHDGSTTA